MKAKELRLGNLIYVKYDGINPQTKIRKVSLATISEVTRDGNDISYKPIPLTEEWLVKFGFYGKYKSVNTQWSLGGFSIQQESNVDEEHNTIPTEQRFHYNWDFVVEYVHSLQNLYFALTGEELAIK